MMHMRVFSHCVMTHAVGVQSAIMNFQEAHGRLPSMDDLADLAFDMETHMQQHAPALRG